MGYNDDQWWLFWPKKGWVAEVERESATMGVFRGEERET